jgi:hypothetical protein
VSFRFVSCFVATSLAVSCSARTYPPGLTDNVNDATAPVVDTGPPPPLPDGCVPDVGIAPSPDAQGLCGNSFLDITGDPPNLYFVIDRSGSMGEIVDGRTKYDAVAIATVALVRSLGSRANVGAAVFPGPLANDDRPCIAGDEVYPATAGDPLRGGLCGNDGPVTRAFSTAISLPSGVSPKGSTPTAATLTALLPKLASLRGRTVVLLATDGGPNCNANTTCDTSSCIPNIEGASGCTPSVNCCDPAVFGPASCLDREGTTSAVAKLFARGIRTYVVGIPGSAPYANLLNELATAGGTARAGMSTAYYDVEHIGELDDVLATIGATVTLSCQVHLANQPPDPGLVNVYLDGQLIKHGPNGWLWAGSDVDASAGDATTAVDAIDESSAPAEAGPSAEASVPFTEVDLVGEACAMLESGKYRRLQVVFGCPTNGPR